MSKMADTNEPAAEAAEEKPKKGKKTKPEPEPEKKGKKRGKDADAGEKKPLSKAKARKAVEDGFNNFMAKSEKKWPGTTTKAAKIGIMDVPRISTGNVGLDIALFGGWPGGRFSIAFGLEKSGKTGTCLNTVAEWQKNYCPLCYRRVCVEDCAFHGEPDRPPAPVLWIDAENRLEKMWNWVKGHGVNLDYFAVQSPPSGQHVVDFIDSCLREKAANIGLIIVDSVANITSQEEIDKETMKGRTAPLNAQLVNRAIRKWTSAICELGVAEPKKPTVILINQLRGTLDQYKPEVQTGGRGIAYAHSIEVRFNAGKKHYLVHNEKTGEWEDKVLAYGSKFKPGPDDVPDYTEINYRITESGICPAGRYGQFCYWVRPTHGRRIGDPDNGDRLWEYAKRYDLVERDGKLHKLFGSEGESLSALKETFFVDKAAQRRAWDFIVAKLTAPDTVTEGVVATPDEAADAGAAAAAE